MVLHFKFTTCKFEIFVAAGCGKIAHSAVDLNVMQLNFQFAFVDCKFTGGFSQYPCQYRGVALQFEHIGKG